VGTPVVSASRRSSPNPSAGLTYGFGDPCRFEAKAIALPSGDQTGLSSLAASNVNRVLVPRATSTIQRSRESDGPRATAMRVPSGDTAGFAYSPELSPLLAASTTGPRGARRERRKAPWPRPLSWLG